MRAIPIVDVFAGPGGLNEGFSSLIDSHGNPIFRTINSFEMDESAVRTLELRAALRTIRRATHQNPDSYYAFLRGEVTFDSLSELPEFAPALKDALSEVQQVELGPETRPVSDLILRKSLRLAGDGPWVLIGGPPCQAYSLAGRSRRTSDPTFADDHKHVLYREYLHILREQRPTVFVMENVKGMLSSQHRGGSIFEQILDDLRQPANGLHYEVRSFVVDDEDLRPSDFILRAEEFGVPQRRHRVILLGVREDASLGRHQLLGPREQVRVKDAIGTLPRIRSMVSPRRLDSPDLYDEIRQMVRQKWSVGAAGGPAPLGAPFMRGGKTARLYGELGAWITDPGFDGVIQHESRAHMPHDLMRYAYLAAMAEQGEFLKVNELPPELLPNHRNAGRPDAPFADRFRVQRGDRPSTTVVSHISKDGHYYIHPDPNQMRSLSVREAARLQTFPDDYYFRGNRTQQYHQVGNAVPPFLARQLGVVVARLLGKAVGEGKL